MGMALRIDLGEVFKTEDKSIRKWTPKAEALFSFDEKAHPVASGVQISEYFQNRLSGEKQFDLFKTSPSALAGKNHLLNHIGGLYWLEHCINQPDQKLEKMEKLTTLRDVQTSLVSEVIFNYLIAICGGELRHGWKGTTWMAGEKKCEICQRFYDQLAKKVAGHYNSRDFGSRVFWESIGESNEPTYMNAFRSLLHGFCDHSWGSPEPGCGGPNWGYISFLARNLFCAWAEGDIKKMFQNIDYLCHAVHNGANCFYDKFVWYSPGNHVNFSRFLNAKFTGKPCCWKAVEIYIPTIYLNVTGPVPMANVCNCEIKDEETTLQYHKSSEQILFAETYSALDVCKKCGGHPFLGGENSGSCQNFCLKCGDCYEASRHTHYCVHCGDKKEDPNDWKCPNTCLICVDKHLANLQKCSKKLKGEKESLNAKWLYPGCNSKYMTKEGIHRYCHFCKYPGTINAISISNGDMAYLKILSYDTAYKHVPCKNLHILPLVAGSHPKQAVLSFCRDTKKCTICDATEPWDGKTPRKKRTTTLKLKIVKSDPTGALKKKVIKK